MVRAANDDKHIMSSARFIFQCYFENSTTSKDLVLGEVIIWSMQGRLDWHLGSTMAALGQHM